MSWYRNYGKGTFDNIVAEDEIINENALSTKQREILKKYREKYHR